MQGRRAAAAVKSRLKNKKAVKDAGGMDDFFKQMLADDKKMVKGKGKGKRN